MLHATHALETSLRHDGDRWLFHSGVLDLQTQDRTGDFSAVYTASTLGTLPVALAGSVASALRLKSSEAEAPLQPAAAGPYFSGLYFLRRDARSFEQAIPLLNEAVRLEPASPLPPAALAEAQVQRFEAISDRKALDEAQRSLAAARSLNPDSVRVLLVTGLLDKTPGRYEKALESYRRVLEREPRNLEALRQVADVYDKMDIPDKAIATFRQAIALEDPGYYWTYSRLGALYYFRGNYPQAAEQFRNAIARAPGVLQPYINLGGVLSDMGRDAEAEQAFSASLRIKETVSALNGLGASRAYQGHDAQAVEYYLRAIAGNSKNIIYQLNLGDSCRRLGRTAEALAAYRAARQLALEGLKQNPRRAITRAYAGYSRHASENESAAKTKSRRQCSLRPADGTVLHRAVLTYQALGQTERALDALANSTPELIRELNRHPDLAEFRKHPRFVQLTGNAGS